MRRSFIRPAGLAGLAGLAVSALAAVTAQPAVAAGAPPAATTTPIKHVIVIIGENHGFDNVFATYRPPAGQHIRNLLSEGIVTAGGGLGPRARQALQLTASDTASYSLTPKITGAYPALPRPDTTSVSPACDGQPQNSPDQRFPANLPNGPYQITRYVPYLDPHTGYSGSCPLAGAYVGDPIHRFYQMWQQMAGHHAQLQTWTTNTAGDDNGAVPPAPIHQGGVQMGYYNMAAGFFFIFKEMSEIYTISDNYHQAVMGGTGANHIALGTGFAASYQDAAGNAAAPPANQIENPNPKPGTNNSYTQDGYAGGSYSECADPSQPGVGTIDGFLAKLPYRPLANCQPGRYYLLNNYNAGYNVDGTVNTSSPYTVPPQKTDYVTIGNELSARHISWGYFGQGYNGGHPTGDYCGICDPMQYSASIMTNPALRANIQHGYSDFLNQAANGTLPAVTFLKPSGTYDGHPGYSALAGFEDFAARSIAAVQANPALWRSTAIFITFDESGGYYDSGYIQPVSFFGDGARVPMILVSPYARRGAVDHTYNDHVSILKFIEANWRLAPLSPVSEDNLPNATPGVYVPRDRPAIGNLMTMFDFSHPDFATLRLPPYSAPATSPAHAAVISNAQR